MTIRLHLTKLFTAGLKQGMVLECGGIAYPDGMFHRLAMEAEAAIEAGEEKKECGTGGRYKVIGYRIETEPPYPAGAMGRIAPLAQHKPAPMAGVF